MNPTQAMTSLASILSAAAGFDSKGKKYPIIDRKNAVIGSNGDDCLGSNCESDVSTSFIRLLFRNSPRPECTTTAVCRLKDLPECNELTKQGWSPECWVQVTQTVYVDNYSVIAVRCGGRNILHRIRQELAQTPFKISRHKDFKEIPVMGPILDISAFTNDDTLQDRFEANIEIEYCDRALCKVECRPEPCIKGALVLKDETEFIKIGDVNGV